MLQQALKLAEFLLGRLRTGWNESGLWNPSALLSADATEVEALEDELYFRLRGVQRAALLRAGTLQAPQAQQLQDLCDSLAMGASHYAALPSELTELRWLVKKMIDELALRDGAAPQLHSECCHQKGWGGRGTRPAAARAGSFAHQAAAQPAGHCFAPKRPCWSTLAAALHIANTGRGLVVEAVWPGTAF